jgi:hypothetical protein
MLLDLQDRPNLVEDLRIRDGPFERSPRGGRDELSNHSAISRSLRPQSFQIHHRKRKRRPTLCRHASQSLAKHRLSSPFGVHRHAKVQQTRADPTRLRDPGLARVTSPQLQEQTVVGKVLPLHGTRWFGNVFVHLKQALAASFKETSQLLHPENGRTPRR